MRVGFTIAPLGKTKTNKKNAEMLPRIETEAAAGQLNIEPSPCPPSFSSLPAGVCVCECVCVCVCVSVCVSV